jgi:quercetin dioxygenase-like cupin family protein
MQELHPLEQMPVDRWPNIIALHRSVEMSTEHDRQALRPGTGGMITVSVAAEIARLKSTPEWESRDRNAVSLVKDDALNILLMILKQGARLHEHRAKGPIAVQVISGSIRFSAGAERIISAGEIVGLDRNIAHSVEALEESTLILVTAIG